MSAEFGVFTLDTGRRIRSWNQWLESATGLAEAAARELTAAAVVAPSRVELIEDVLAEVIGSGTTRVLSPALHRYLILCPPRQPAPGFAEMQQLVTVAPLRSDADIVGAIVTIEDVTDRLARQQQEEAVAAGGDEVVALGSADWRVRAAAAGRLRQSATREQVAELLASLQRDHHDFSVLSGALQVLIAVNRDVTAPLGELLGDVDANVRMHAALALGSIGDDGSVPLLIRALDDPDSNVRFHAIEALGRMRAGAAVEPLARIAGTGDFFLGFPAIDALARIDDDRVAPALVELMDQELLRPAIVDALAELGDEDSVAPLVGLLNSGTGESMAVATALARIAARYQDSYEAGDYIADLTRQALHAEGVERVCADLRVQPAPGEGTLTVADWTGAALEPLLSLLGNPDLQPAVVSALSRIGARALRPLAEVLRDGAPDARLAAVAALERIGDRRAVPFLVETLNSHDAALVAAAAGALGQLGDAAALDPLIALFAHPQLAVRLAAMAAVQSLGANRTMASIRARLHDGDPRVRECAVRVAGYYAFDECAAGVRAALHDDVPEVRRAALEQLPLIDPAGCVGPLVGALQTETTRNRAAAAHALRSVDAPATEAALVAALQDDDPWVRYFAASSLEERGGDSSADALSGIARFDRSPPARIAATKALGRAAPETLAALAPVLVADADDDVAAAAIEALADVDDPAVDALLEGALEGSRDGVSLAAATALGRRPHASAVDMLAWAARLAEPAALAGVALDGLRRLAGLADTASGSAATAVLVGLAADPSRRDSVVSIVGTLPPEVIGTIEHELQSSRPDVRAALVGALARMRHPEATQALARALGDEHPGVRAAAVAAFGRLGSPVAATTIARLAKHDPDPVVRRRAASVCRRYGWTDDDRRGDA